MKDLRMKNEELVNVTCMLDKNLGGFPARLFLFSGLHSDSCLLTPALIISLI